MSVCGPDAHLTLRLTYCSCLALLHSGHRHPRLYVDAKPCLPPRDSACCRVSVVAIALLIYSLYIFLSFYVFIRVTATTATTATLGVDMRFLCCRHFSATATTATKSALCVAVFPSLPSFLANFPKVWDIAPLHAVAVAARLAVAHRVLDPPSNLALHELVHLVDEEP